MGSHLDTSGIALEQKQHKIIHIQDLVTQMMSFCGDSIAKNSVQKIFSPSSLGTALKVVEGWLHMEDSSAI